MVIPPGLMEYLRSVQIENMNEEAMITNYSEGIPDGSGGSIPGEITIGPIPCYRFPEVAGVGEIVIAGQIAQGLRWKLGFPVGTDVREESVIDVAGTLYEVIAIVAPASYNSVLLVYCIKR